jgi:hypothetical protein
MSLNLERRQINERRAARNKEKEKKPVTKDDIIIFKSLQEEQAWRLSQLMKDPVRC